MIVHAGEMEPDTAWLSALLDAEAESYTPDAGRLSASVYERLAGAREVRARAFAVPIRLAGIPVGVAAAALCATVAMAVTASVGTGPPNLGSSPTPSPVPDPSAPASPLHSPDPAASSDSGVRAGAPAATATGTHTIAVAGQLDAGDNASWSQEKVIVSLARPAVSFQLTVKVAMSPKVASAGSWTTYSPNLIDVSVQTEADGVVYVFQLRPGQVLPSGDAQFAVQFMHDASHNPAADTYSLTSNTDAAHGGSPTVLHGTF